MDKYSLRHKSKYSIIRALISGSIDQEEVMRAHDIFTSLASLEPDVAAFVYRSRKDRFYIIVNEHLSFEAQQEVYFHELCHIIEDMPKAGYVLGLNMQREKFEVQADRFAREIAVALAVK